MTITRVALLATILCTLPTAQARQFYQPHRPALTHHDSAAVTGAVNIHSYTCSYGRTAHRAFGNGHGFSTGHLSGLYFGKDEFRGTQMFKNCLMSQDAQHYNPYIRILKMRPRVQYSEYGTTVGFSASTTSSSKKTRFGVRIDLPIIRREIERKDQGARGPAPTQDLVSEQDVTVYQAGSTDPNDINEQRVKFYRLDLIESLNKNSNFHAGAEYLTNDIKLMGQSLKSDGDFVAGGFIKLPEGSVPRGQHLWTSQDASTDKTNLPTTFTPLSTGTVYEVTSSDYSSMADSASKTVAQRISDQDTKATMWLIPSFDDSLDTPTLNENAGFIQSGVDNALKDFNANQYEWFYDRGYQFASTQQIGIGDINLEAFVNIDCTPKATVDLCAGLTIPSATGSTSAANPYNTHLGKRKHPVLFAGAGFETQLKNPRFRFAGDIRYSFVIPSDEQRCAMPIGAQVKNIGTPATARTSWNEVNGSLWLHAQHPYADTISYSLGYQFFHKTKDRIAFKHAKVTSWLGNLYDTSKSARTFSLANQFTPNASASALNTAGFAHTIVARMNYRVSEWIKINLNSSYVIAGKNTPQILEVGIGCVVAF